MLLAPGKMVYLPLAALLLLVPGPRLGHHAKAKKAAYLAVCVALALVLNTGTLTATTGTASEETTTTSTAAEATAVSTVPRAEKARPAEPDAAYEGSDLRGEHAGKLRAAPFTTTPRTPAIPPRVRWISGCRP